MDLQNESTGTRFPDMIPAATLLFTLLSEQFDWFVSNIQYLLFYDEKYLNDYPYEFLNGGLPVVEKFNWLVFQLVNVVDQGLAKITF